MAGVNEASFGQPDRPVNGKPVPNAATAGVDKIVSLMSSTGMLSQEPIGEPSKSTPVRDWSSAIELIQEAAAAIRISSNRADDLETQLKKLTAQTSEEIKRLTAQVAATELSLAKTEEQLRVAEARADEAEGWLVRLHDATVNAFSPSLAMDEPSLRSGTMTAATLTASKTRA